MFDLYDTERLAEWKRLRDSLETSQTPLEDILRVWKMAPFVSPYLDPDDSKSWPDPWKLIIDGRFDHLAICLGMLYTAKLTQRFMDSKYEIHMSMSNKEFYLSIDGIFLDQYTGEIINRLDNETSIVWQS